VTHPGHQVSERGTALGGELVIGSFRSPANQAAQVSLVSGDAADHEDSVLSVDVDDVDASYALARATGLLPDDDKCQAYIANVHRAFRSGS
jgi:hypothetical protein